MKENERFLNTNTTVNLVKIYAKYWQNQVLNVEKCWGYMPLYSIYRVNEITNKQLYRLNNKLIMN